MSSKCDLKLHAWCDANWGGCRNFRRSASGWFVTLRQSPVQWKTKKQDVVKRSSAEAEYRSMDLTVCELKWLKILLVDFDITHNGPIDLHCDSQAAIYIAANPVFYERTKFVEIDCHGVRDAVQDGLIATRKVSKTEQLSDIFPKALGKREFTYLLGRLGILNPHTPT